MLCAVVVLCAAAAGVWFGYLKHKLLPENWDVVEARQAWRLYRSGQLSDRVLRQMIDRYQIGVIVSLASDQSEGPEAQAEARIAKKKNVARYNFPLNGDGIGDPTRYAEAIQIIDQAEHDSKPVLVHCHSGAQRTGGVIAIYQVLVEGKSPADVYADMLRHGYDAKGNAALIPFLNEHMEQWAKTLVGMKVIGNVPDPLPRFTP